MNAHGSTGSRIKWVTAGLVLLLASLLAACNVATLTQTTRSRYADRIALGDSHTCFVTPNGEVYCWGLNDSGQLGQGLSNAPNPYDSVAPLRVPLASRVNQVAAGLDFTCVLDEFGDVYCFGNRAFGRLGNGTDSQGPEAVPEPQLVQYSGDFIQIAAGAAHACGLRASGRISCWGGNNRGQVGPNANVRQLTPYELRSAVGFIDVTAGWEHTCGLRSDRRVECWGKNSSGQLGDGTFISRAWSTFVLESVPGIGPVQLEDIVDLEAGANHTCAIKADGRVVCWGLANSGQIGDGHQRITASVALFNGMTEGVALGSGPRADRTCLLRGDGNTFCWGTNDHGQIGNGSLSPFVNPPAGPLIGNGVVEVAAGFNHTCALVADGRLMCWGYNQWGEVGDGALVKDISKPNLVAGLPNTLTGGQALSLGNLHTCALKSDGTGYCWGANGFGQLGDGSTNSVAAPANPINYTGFGPGTYAKGIELGNDFGCALMSYGSVRCWGKNTVGQLGDGTTNNATTGVAVTGINTAIGVATGQAHACALLSDGTLHCWGDNAYGQLGDSTNLNRLNPMLSYRDRASKVVAGQSHTCALVENGQVVCWGRDNFGQLGDGCLNPPLDCNVDQSVALVVALGGVIDLAAGNEFTCALRDDGTVWCWGRNLEGQLGDGSNTSQVTAIQVDTTSTGKIVELTAGGTHACALSTGGRSYCWGDNSYGQLGDGTLASKNLPTPVDPQSLPVNTFHLSAGNRHTCAFAIDGTLRCWGFNLYGQVGLGASTGYEPLPVLVANFP
jgi:alpha-tubulin suppressor-like RCC1 family protein